MATSIRQYLPTQSPPQATLIPLAKCSIATAMQPLFPQRRRWRCPRISNSSNRSRDGAGNDRQLPANPDSIPDTERIRSKRGLRKLRQQRKDGSTATLKAKSSSPAAAAPKTWEEMSVSEKAIELYVGERGLLFWLNKFAYASIFIVIGGWIVFRFVGPALNLYQLDSPPLAPTSIFKSP